MPLWDKGQDTDALIQAFCVGDDYQLDARLVAYDVRASQAHARMLAAQGYLTAEEAEQLVADLDRLAESHQNGAWQIEPHEEDCHTALETRLGDLGKKIHLGRSRNDQVLVALRLWMRDALNETAAAAEAIADALDALPRDIALPGYTHLQRAMPSTSGLWAEGYASEFRQNATACRLAHHRLRLNPLGTAAGYGTPGINLDRDQTTRELGFEAPEPTTAAQLSRGKAEAACLFEWTQLAQDLGRLAADLCLYASAEFGFIKLPEAFTTGSSIMPQKRNPDVFELVRGRSVTVAYDLQTVLAITSKMPSGYHRDLQEIKRPLFRGFDTTMALAEVMKRALGGIEFDRERCAAAMDAGLFATEEANRLVTEQGMSFRDAYRIVGEKFRPGQS